jgi:hypothetical protein
MVVQFSKRRNERSEAKYAWNSVLDASDRNFLLSCDSIQATIGVCTHSRDRPQASYLITLGEARAPDLTS